MIIGSFIAFHLFAIAGVALAWTTGLVASSWPVLFMYFECFSISFLHAADVLLAIGYWRHRNSYRPKFDPPPDEMTINSAGNDGDI
ncbi:hypothetical protein PV326_012350 [Microctonus aethiopoides]|nr:hypothetical protein PV326_012350 [Microctonus aethiopoides]